MESLRSSVIALAFVALPGFLCGQTISSSYDNYRVLTVSGDAEIRVSPDLVLLSLGVDTRQPKLRQARVENDSAIQAVTQALRSLGVNADDIHTDYLNVHIQYNNGVANTIDGYSVERAMGVSIRKVADFDRILSAVLDAGANQIYGVEFRTTELRKYRDQARAAAVKAAIDKASDLARAAGLSLNIKPLGLSNYTDSGGSSYGRPNGNNQFQSQNISQVPGSGGLQGSAAPGQLSVTASVTVSFLVQ